MNNKITIILGSSRQNSIGKYLFNNFKKNKAFYEEITKTSINLVKVGDYHLPFFYESLPPMNNPHRELSENEQNWLDIMNSSNGFIFLTPEYNHSIPAVLKNALDFLSIQGKNKPTKIISYSDNTRAGQFGAKELAPILMRLGFLVLPNFAAIGNVQKNFSPEGDYLTDAPSKKFYTNTLQELMREIAFYTVLLTDNPF